MGEQPMQEIDGTRRLIRIGMAEVLRYQIVNDVDGLVLEMWKERPEEPAETPGRRP